ncbi:MAG: L-threonylcarbamoyladenylate synthase [Pseudomonadota bacterium]
MATGAGETRRLAADPAGIAETARLLATGRLVAFPTETVYGLGADARNAAAVAALYAAKGRPSRNPLIVHVADSAAAEAIARIGPLAMRLADAFWPGPLTMVLPLRAEAALAPAVTAGRDTVGLRVPAGPVARTLIAAAGCPVAAPSANPSGKISPTSADHVLDPAAGLAGRIDAVLDAGPATVGVESTILAVEEAGPMPRVRLLRPGGIGVEALSAALRGVQLDLSAGEDGGTAPLAAPGLMVSHYAPRARLRLDAEAPMAGEAWLGFGPDPATAASVPVADTLSPGGDTAEAATRLFAALRRLDAALPKGGTIAVAPVPMTGLGRAVNDRLARAAATRPGDPESGC